MEFGGKLGEGRCYVDSNELVSTFGFFYKSVPISVKINQEMRP